MANKSSGYFKKLLVFLDIDGTLIMPNQKTNSNALTKVIKKMSREGIIFGLNSNRSYKDIIGIYKKFHLNGPVILENGVYFKKSLSSAKIFFISNPQKLNNLFQKAAEEFAKNQKLNYKILVEDTVKIIKSKSLSNLPLAILLNKFREYTGSIYIYRYGKNDAYLSQKLVLFLRNYFKKNKLNFLVESPKSFGNVVFWPKEINKGIAFKKIKKYYPDHQFVMIGDDLADLKTRKEVKYFFAVKNAQKAVKRESDYVSKEEYTKGVAEILHYLRNIF